VPAGSLVAETDRLARQLAEKPPVQLAAVKRAFYAQMDLGVAQAYELASGVIAASFAHQKDGKAWMPSSRSATHRAGHGTNRSAASTAKTGASSVLEPRSWRAPVTSTISLGTGISAAAAHNSSMDPNGSAVPCVNTVGTLMSRQMLGASLPRQKRCPVQGSSYGDDGDSPAGALANREAFRWRFQKRTGESRRRASYSTTMSLPDTDTVPRLRGQTYVSILNVVPSPGIFREDLLGSADPAPPSAEPGAHGRNLLCTTDIGRTAG
jgi:hypothetical protein